MENLNQLQRTTQVATGAETSPVTYAELEQRAADLCDLIKDDPQARLKVRKAFYMKYGDEQTRNGAGYGTSELGFMEWEIRRGVLNPIHVDSHQKKGSPWWYNVNLEFIYWSELAALVFENNIPTEDLPAAVRFWVDYIQNPNTTTWYRAHNTSISMGYCKFINLAKDETYFEQVFINEVFYRLMYAGAMGEGIDIPFEKIGHILFDPRIPTLNIVVAIPAFYPQNYPLTEKDIENVLYQGRGIGVDLSRALNEALILPGLENLYAAAVTWLEIPEIATFIKDDQPIYPYPPENLKPASGPVKGLAQSYMALVSMKNEEVEAMLPPEMSLLPQTISPEGEHPVFFFFNYNRLHLWILPWPVFTYGELAILIPNISYKGSQEPHAFTPILWVNSKFVSWLGHVFWKFNKLYADITVTKPIPKGPAWFTAVKKFSFDTVTKENPVATMTCENDGAPGMFNSFPNARALKGMLNQKGIMGFNGKYVGVTVSMDYDTAEVQPSPGVINIQNMPNLKAQRINVPSLNQTVLGGFRINWDITLSWPEKI